MRPSLANQSQHVQVQVPPVHVGLLYEQILKLALYDLLTGLPNRHLLLQKLNDCLNDVESAGSYGALILIDLDNFKTINDQIGHEMADELLTEAGRRLVEIADSSDTVSRFGNDEFVVLLSCQGLTEVEALQHAQHMVTQLRSSLERPYPLHGLLQSPGACFGVSVFGQTLITAKAALRQVELALQQAKSNRATPICYYSARMQRAIDDKNRLELSLRAALRQSRLILMYQPQIDRQGKLIGAEALVRWCHPERGMLLPGEFIGHAEETGLIVQIGQWVLETACYQLACWQEFETTRRLRLSVNISARQFRQDDFVDRVTEILNRTGVDPSLLQLEITESALLDNVSNAIERMTALRRLGIGFAIDDFGTGYSSLSYLKRLPVNEIKIDRSFVHDVNTDPESAAIVCAIIVLSHTLNMKVFAEGVEARSQHEFLQQQGCDAYQGYLFGRPVASTDSLLSCVH